MLIWKNIIYKRSLLTGWPAPGVSPLCLLQVIIYTKSQENLPSLVGGHVLKGSEYTLNRSFCHTTAGRIQKDPRSSLIHQNWLTSFQMFGKWKPHMYLCLALFYLIKVQEYRLYYKSYKVLQNWRIWRDWGSMVRIYTSKPCGAV